ncbi:MAG: hypothetical protein HQL09_03720 [Nitrospirae bacterium]|nr:hypothetical protein [Nitrospirota bacterium]
MERGVRPFYFRAYDSDTRYWRPSNADGKCHIADALAESLGVKRWNDLENIEETKKMLVTIKGQPAKKPFSGQSCGTELEKLVRLFIEDTFIAHLLPLRPGTFRIERGGKLLEEYDQYRHLKDMNIAIEAIHDIRVRNRVRANFASYSVKPDLLLARKRISKDAANSLCKGTDEASPLVDKSVANNTVLFQDSGAEDVDLLHGIISVKWTIRSDRAQNARTEGAFSTRERRGRAPHFVVVVGEPRPSRIRSLAMGVDIDCVYHVCLPELEQVIHGIGSMPEDDKTTIDEAATDEGLFANKQTSSRMTELDWLNVLKDLNRLRDISDLPFDLVI